VRSASRPWRAGGAGGRRQQEGGCRRTAAGQQFDWQECPRCRGRFL